MRRFDLLASLPCLVLGGWLFYRGILERPPDGYLAEAELSSLGPEDWNKEEGAAFMAWLVVGLPCLGALCSGWARTPAAGQDG